MKTEGSLLIISVIFFSLYREQGADGECPQEQLPSRDVMALRGREVSSVHKYWGHCNFLGRKSKIYSKALILVLGGRDRWISL